MSRSRGYTSAILAILAVLGAVGVGAPAQAASEPNSVVEIGAMSLDDALHALARQTRLQLLYSPADVQGLQAGPVRGAYTPREALARMLQGTGLVMEMRAADTAVIRRAPPARPKYIPAALQLAAPASAPPPAEAAPPPVAEPQVQVQEVMVTARRRSEAAQRVPIAITTIGGATLVAAGVQNITQVQQLAPSLQVTQTNPRSTNINIRGIGSSVALTSAGLDNGVGIYVDQVYYGRSGQATFDLVDLAQVEVLRGPQGTLFGKNTTGGAINITTRAPTFTPEGSLQAEYGNYDAYRVLGSLSGPLIGDKLAGRFSFGTTNRNDGVLTNIHDNSHLGNLHDLQLRGQLLAKPVDSLSIRFIADYDRQTSRCCQEPVVGYATTRVDGTPIPNSFAVRAARAGIPVPPVDPSAREINQNLPARYHQEQWGVTAIADWRLGAATVTSVTAYRHWNWWPYQDADGLPLDIFHEAFNADHFRQFSQELRIASSDDTAPITYVAGLYYYTQRIAEGQHVVYGADAPLWVLGASTPVTQAALSGFGARGWLEATTDSYAAFAQGTWHATDKASLTAGLRYTYEHRDGAFTQLPIGGASLSTLPPAQAAAAQAIRNSFARPVNYTATLSQGEVSGDVNFAYQFTPRVMSYVTYSRGFKGGGLNLTALPPTVAPVQVAPEHVDDYEVGLKSTLFDRRLVLNLAAYWLNDSNYQNSLISLTSNLVTYVANAGEVRSRGFEFDAHAAVLEGLTLYASGAYDDAIYASYTNAPCPIEYQGLRTICDLSGKPLPGVSRYSASAGGEVWRPVTLGSREAQAYLGLDYSYRSSFYAVFNDAAAARAPGYSLLNLRLGLRTGEHWDAYFYMRNATNTTYPVVENLGAFNTGSVVALLGDPRTFGVGLKASF